MNRIGKIKMNKIRYKLVCLFTNNHYKWLKKHNIFAEIGENVLYQPDTLPNNPKLIKIHNNVRIASGVIFYEHDVINSMFVNMKDGTNYRQHLSSIEIFDNVFIGGRSIIIGDVKIGPNAIIGAGSVITKDVEEGTVVAGNPARVIGKFEDVHEKRRNIDGDKPVMTYEERYKEIWANQNTKGAKK